MKKTLLMITTCAVTLSIITVSAQETEIRFFGQPENNNSDVSEKNYFFITSQLGERISELSFNNSGKMFNFEVSRLMLLS